MKTIFYFCNCKESTLSIKLPDSIIPYSTKKADPFCCKYPFAAGIPISVSFWYFSRSKVTPREPRSKPKEDPNEHMTVNCPDCFHFDYLIPMRLRGIIAIIKDKWIYIVLFYFSWNQTFPPAILQLHPNPLQVLGR